jgi:hypothetical protein
MATASTTTTAPRTARGIVTRKGVSELQTTRFARKGQSVEFKGTTTLGEVLASFGKIEDGKEISVTLEISVTSLMRQDQVPSLANASDKESVMACLSQAEKQALRDAQALLASFNEACKSQAKSRLAGQTRQVWLTKGTASLA